MSFRHSTTTRPRGMRRAMGIAMLVFAAAACGTDPPARLATEGADQSSANEDADRPVTAEVADRASILAAAALELVTNDNGFGRGPDPFVAIDVVERFGAPATTLRQDLDGDLLSDADRDAIAAAFAPRAITWVPRQFDPDARPTFAASGAVPEPRRGVVLLAMPEIDDNTAKVAVSLGCGSWCFTGGSYALRKSDGKWSITGKPNGWWIT